MLRRNFLDTFMDDFFVERDRYLGTISDRMNNLYDDLDDTYRTLLNDTDLMESEEQPVQRIRHYESNNKRVYTDDKGRKHLFEKRIENLPNEDNKFKVITTKRIIPKGKSIEDIKKIPDSQKKKSLKDAGENDFVEEVTEDIKEGLPERHLEMLDNWYGRNLLDDTLEKSIEPSKEKKQTTGQKSVESSKKQGDKLQEKEKKKGGEMEKVSDADKKKQIESLRKEFDQQFNSIQKQFESMKKNMFDKLDSEKMLSSKSSQV